MKKTGQPARRRPGRNILLGVTGSIAAYRAADIAGKLVREGCGVHAVLTRSARRFVRPLTFKTITGNPVATDLWGREKLSRAEHIDLARKTDLVLIAPATATTLARLAQGLADEVLSATVLATDAPVVLAPAMNPVMWASGAVKENAARLRARGHFIVEPAEGRVACGEEGRGRLADVDEIVATAKAMLAKGGRWRGKRVLVTAGPTREALDGVRFISNPSSGKMGFALAELARRRGAQVTLISGPVALPVPFGVRTIRVMTGGEMRCAVKAEAMHCDALFMAAAVTDYRATAPARGKTTVRAWRPGLRKVDNILDEIKGRGPKRLTVGFAAQMGDPEREARRKLKSHGLDMIVGNDVSSQESGFATDRNRAVLIFKDGRIIRLGLIPKIELAAAIMDSAEPLLPCAGRRRT